MPGRSPLLVTIFILLPLGVATGILAGFTIGEVLAPRESAWIGLAVALLAVMTAAYLMLFSDIAERPGSRLSAMLVGSGAACILAAVGLQFYLASVASDSARRAAEIFTEAIRQKAPLHNVNTSANVPPSVHGMGYLALFAGIWLAAVGIRVGVAPGERTRESPFSRQQSPEPVRGVDTGFREA